MPIVYALVGRGTSVVGEFSGVCFLEEDGYVFHILIADALTFLWRIPFLYLEDIHMRFMNNYGKVAPYAPPYAMNDEFSRVLHQQMEFFCSNTNADPLTRVRREVGELRTITVDNIDKILDRGERIVVLVDKTATMQGRGFHFRKQSRRLRRALWIKNTRLLASLTCLIVLLLYIIIAASCGGIRLHSCRFHHHIL